MLRTAKLSLFVMTTLSLPLWGCSGDGKDPSTPSTQPTIKPLPEKLVIAHRGASAYVPEHTIAAYTKGIELGADVIEPDLVSTKDGELVTRHENEISGTTDVADRPEFADRKATKTVDGAALTGWFTEDFTLAELKTLRAKERIPEFRPDNTQHNGKYEIPTLEEVISLAQAKTKETGRTIAIYPETKHPTYFQGIGLAMEDKLLQTLDAKGYKGPDAPVFIQSFEVANLKAMRQKTDMRLVQLIGAVTAQPYDFVVAMDTRTYADMIKPDGLTEIAVYAQGLGPEKSLIIPRNADKSLGAPTTLVNDAHTAGLVVHPYTFRPENNFLPLDFQNVTEPEPSARGDGAGEITVFLKTGIDGFFTDAADLGRAALDDYLKK
jgi:glycerophosphoryl diester phosphodiesterase